MNREIKFRAMTLDGKLVYGYYELKHITDLNKKDGIREEYTINDGFGLSYNIVPETLEQYTGLKDKNGTKIYEGDVVRILKKFGHFRDKGETLEVYWNKKLLQYGLTINSGSYHKNESFDWLQLTETKSQYLEVIGNIHEVSNND